MNTKPNDEKTAVPSDPATGSFAEGLDNGFWSAPWFLVPYMFAFILFCEVDWKVGVAWLFWRLASNSRIAWEKRKNVRMSEGGSGT